MIHLHTHDDQGSFLDSTNTPKSLANRAKELGMTAIATTNHGYCSSHVEFYKECQKIGIKPILGCELYVCDNMKVQDPNSRYDHLIVLAKDRIGYRNLLKLSSIGFTDGFYYKPRVDFETLLKYKDGLVVLTACLGGELPRRIMNKANNLAELFVTKYKRAFGSDFYLEVQSAKNPEQEKVNKELANLSKKFNVPLVVTSDAHFLKKEDYDLHGIFIKTNQDRDNEFYQDCWLKSENEVFEVIVKHIGFEDTLEAIANTHTIADKCNVELQLGKSYLPDYPIPPQFANDIEYLRYLVNKGFKERGLDKLTGELRQTYVNRLKEEFDIITVKNYTGYFLIVQDFLERCRQNGIYLGDGRGSADNSLICFVLHITNVDPILYDLNFSRFLTLERVELPDIDMDIQSSMKAVAVHILREVYGFDKVAQIATFQTMQAKASMDKIGKVLGVPYTTTTEIKKHIPDGMSLKDAILKSSQLVQYQQKYPELFDYCMRLEGLKTGISVHAGGVVIAPSNMDMAEFTAVALSSDKEIITQYEMKNVEEVGLVKMDCLATVTLDVIQDTLSMVWGDE